MSATYIGGPLDGGTNPETQLTQIAMRTPMGSGRYVRDTDENGTMVYRWEPEQD